MTMKLTEDQEYLLSMAARSLYMKRNGSNSHMSRRPTVEYLDVGVFLVWKNELGYEIARFKVTKNLKVRML